MSFFSSAFFSLNSKNVKAIKKSIIVGKKVNQKDWVPLYQRN